MTRDVRIAFAGDRAVAVEILAYLIEEERVPPVALLLPTQGRASHDEELLRLCPHLSPEAVLRGRGFMEDAGVSLLSSLDLDYLISIHFPYLVPRKVLDLPARGCLNLHPALLPYNRGWHTASWAILDGSPMGATLHVMDEGLDTGDIVHQREIEVTPADTAHTLYQRVLEAEIQVFREAWPAIAAGTYDRRPQSPAEGSEHARRDLFDPRVQRLALDEVRPVEDVLRRLRALTTSRPDEACYFEQGGRRYRVQVTLTEEAPPAAPASTEV